MGYLYLRTSRKAEGGNYRQKSGHKQGGRKRRSVGGRRTIKFEYKKARAEEHSVIAQLSKRKVLEKTSVK